MNEKELKEFIEKSGDRAKVRGFMRTYIRGVDGKIRDDSGFIENTITNTGLAALAGLAGNVGSVAAFTYLAVGESNTAASASQTALVTEITTSGLARSAATVTRSTTTQTNDTLQLDKTWTASGAKTVEEIGVFNDATTGIMLGRKVTGTKALAIGEDLVATYKIIFA